MEKKKSLLVFIFKGNYLGDYSNDLKNYIAIKNLVSS